MGELNQVAILIFMFGDLDNIQVPMTTPTFMCVEEMAGLCVAFTDGCRRHFRILGTSARGPTAAASFGRGLEHGRQMP